MFRNDALGYFLGDTYDVRRGIDIMTDTNMTVGYRELTQGLTIRTNGVPTRQLDVVHVGVTACHEVRHLDYPKDSTADSGTIELTEVFSVRALLGQVIMAGKADRDGIDGIGGGGGGGRHGSAPFS